MSSSIACKVTPARNPNRWYKTFLIIVIISFSLTFKFAPAEAGQVFAEWDFNSPEEFSGWQTLDVVSQRIDGGFLIVSAGKLPRIGVSSSRPFSGPVLAVLRLKTSRQGQGTIFISTSTNEILEKQFTLQGNGNEIKEIKIYLGDLLKQNDSVNGFAVEFPGENGDIQIDRVQFREADALDKVSLAFSKFLEFEGISVITINNIETPGIGPVSFTLALIVFTGICSLILFAVLKMPIVKAASWSFLLSALIFIARMDYNWVQAWQTNTLPLSRMNMDDRISFLYKGSLDEFYRFLKKIKASVPQGETVRPAAREFDNYLAKIARYYLLPVRTSECGRYFWIYNEETYFDPNSRSLMKNGQIVVPSVYPVFLNGDNGLFRRIGGDQRCK